MSTTEAPPKAPPFDTRIEDGVIGVMLVSPEAAALVRPILTPECFYGLVHQRVYSIILDLLDAGATPDVALVANAMMVKHNVQRREITSSLDYMRGQGVGYILNAQHYAHIVAQFAQRRELLTLTGDAYRRASDLTTDPGAVAAQLAERLGTIAAGAHNPARDGAELRTLSDVTPEALTWLWPGRIPLGKLTLLAGDPGLGKSLLALDCAARVSTGSPWPDLPGAPRSEVGDVLILTAEDDLSDTVRPRLDAAGADCARIVALEAVSDAQDDDGQRRRAFDLTRDIGRLDAALDTLARPRLVVIDPLTAYMGQVDSHHNAEVRAVLSPLAELAQRRRVAVLGVTHLRKSGGRAIYRTIGSLAFAASARAVLGVAADDDDESRRLLLPIKMNLARDNTGMAFSIAACPLTGLGELPRVCWEAAPIAQPDVDRYLSGDEEQGGRAAHARGEAEGFLRTLLTAGPCSASEAEAAAEAVGISPRTLKRAKAALNVVSQKTADGPWAWTLPESKQ